ncbi:putative inactive cadmium/zinc-transporting ATPase HMA3 [Selaginella moellendorffii]|uniref:putative inactive cadmium/zinc-transporting ATPase HMA3 n=1 Tax=Selaginella moellendorffii TaxID=88036 RepID=UPI000D1C23A2|nr:putative inactive cadmium/zinc-transporting ATPase HMA3 [Selaginella moellendorffii]|eukprot:XP_024529175.1 putative inactive cadmium/zinc-transporting ATPase HMA3 [Selaginella moellendorffii]
MHQEEHQEHKEHKEGDHLLILEGDAITYVAVPDKGRICFVDHHTGTWAPLPESERCCLKESQHVHAHVHHGDTTEDVLLEQCVEEACWALPMSWNELTSSHRDEHKHDDDCGHNQIPHGDHYDFLVPKQDGSYALVRDAGDSQYEHGRLVKVGESLGKLKRRPKQQLMDIFSYQTTDGRGYEILAEEDDAVVHSPRLAENILSIPENFQQVTRTVLSVMGLCCPSEVPLVRKILEPLPGVKEVSVNYTSRSVTVVHDKLLTPEGRLVKALNEARLDASLHRRGELKKANKWPSPWTICCGILLLVSFFKHFWNPLKWMAIGAVAVGIPPILMRSIASLRRWILDINILMLIAVGGAIALADYIEAGSIVFLFTLAEWLEGRSSEQARSALASGLDVPRNAILAETGAMVSVDEVKLGSSIAVKAGEMIPVDGTILSGGCSLDESSLTGESKPVEKTCGSEVWAGTVNLAGYITVQTTALAEDSAVSRMIKLVEEAQAKRSHFEQLVEKFAKFYTPVLVATALGLALIPLIAHVRNEKHWLYLALVLLVVACPCALVLSTPVAVACGIQHAARLGVVIKGGSYLEILAKIKCLAMDKTGTLTEGHFRVSEVVAVGETEDLQQILYWLASVESRSSHPMAAALVTYASLQDVVPSKSVTDFQIIEGEGVSAVVDGHLIEIGNARLASRLGWSNTAITKLATQTATIGWVGKDHQLLAVFSLEDHVREEAAEAVRSLKRLNVQIHMLTGDNNETAQDVQSKLGGVTVHAGLLPQDKVRIIQELKENAGVTGMIGDGINDAPALAAADVGFAMGLAGSAVAMETSDVFLMTDDLRKLGLVVSLGRRVRTKVIQNVVISVGLKAAMLALSFAGYGYLWMAVLVDVGACLLVISNSTLLLRGTGKTRSSGNHHRHGKNCKDHDHDQHSSKQSSKDDDHAERTQCSDHEHAAEKHQLHRHHSHDHTQQDQTHSHCKNACGKGQSCCSVPKI